MNQKIKIYENKLTKTKIEKKVVLQTKIIFSVNMSTERFTLEDYDLGQYDLGSTSPSRAAPYIPPEDDIDMTLPSYDNPNTHNDGQYGHMAMSGNFGWGNQSNPNNIHGFNGGINRQPAGRPPRFNRPNIDAGFGRATGHQLDPMAGPNEFQTLHAGARVLFKFKCFPLVIYEMTAKDSEKEKLRLMQCSNKIIAPNSVLQKLCQYGNIQSEHVFQINRMKNRVSIEIYSQYDEFSETNDTIYVPNYIFESLGIEYGDEVELSFINEVIPKGTKIKLQPITNKIQEVQDYETFLTQHLQAYYTCLIKGDTIKFPYYDEHIEMIIHDLEPTSIVSITNTDLEVDFEPSVEQREKEARMEAEMEAKRIADMKRIEESKRNVSSSSHLKSFGKNMHKLNYDELNSDENYKNQNQEFMKQPEAPQQPEFVPFQGTGRSLNGKVEPKIDVSNIGNPNVSLRFNRPEPNQTTPSAKLNEVGLFQGQGNTLGGSNKPSDINDAKLRRAKFLDRLEAMKPKTTQTNNKLEKEKPVDKKPEIVDDKQFVDELIDDMQVDEPTKPKAKSNSKDKKKKLKFVLKKNRTPKPDFLQSDDSKS